MRNIPTSKSPKPLLSVEEAAVLMGETRSTLYRALKAGTFPLPVFRSYNQNLWMHRLTGGATYLPL